MKEGHLRVNESRKMESQLLEVVLCHWIIIILLLFVLILFIFNYIFLLPRIAFFVILSDYGSI